MNSVRAACAALAKLWGGPPQLPRRLGLEWRIIQIRWLALAFVAPALLLTALPPDRLAAAYAILIVAAIYNYWIQRTITRHPTFFESGYVSAIGDGLLSIGFITVGGGFDTPFYYILMTVALGVAMRHGHGPSLIMAGLYVGFDFLEHAGGPALLSPQFVFRSVFIVITALLASYLGEQARRAEAALEKRLRLAHRLNEATAMLSASLEVQAVLEAVAAASAHLFGSSCAVLLPSPELAESTDGTVSLIRFPRGETGVLPPGLIALCFQYRDAADREPTAGGRSYEDRLPSGDPAIVLVLSIETHEAPRATLVLATPLGSADVSLDPDIVGSFLARVGLAIDNASLYRSLRSSSQDLQRAYADLAATHRELQELISLDEMKNSLLANVSHELRTPLSSIRAFSELLLSYQDDPEVQREFLTIINSESERLTRLVGDILDVAKIETGHLEWHFGSINVPDLIHECVRAQTSLVDREAIALEEAIEPDLPAVWGDRDRLHQVIVNLLSNALKFTERGFVRVSARREADHVCVSVQDTGIGIAPGDQDRVFEKFQQVGPTLTNKPPGTGLGLTICRDIVRHHGGVLWVESEPGRGSTFTFTLPLRPASASASAPAPEGAQQLAAIG